MDSFSKNFVAWMDSNGFKTKDLAPIIGKSAGTLANWRSNGVPERKNVRNFLTSFMRDYRPPQNATQDNQNMIPFTDEQYALVKKAGELTQLSTKEFVRMAATERATSQIREGEADRMSNFPPLSKVAEEEIPYRTNEGKA